jgi:hypothetical protein
MRKMYRHKSAFYIAGTLLMMLGTCNLSNSQVAPSYDGALTYIHKVKRERNIYFFSNSTDNQVNTSIALRGDRNLEIWNPHTGEKQKADVIKTDVKGESVSTVKLFLDPVS